MLAANYGRFPPRDLRRFQDTIEPSVERIEEARRRTFGTEPVRWRGKDGVGIEGLRA